MNIGIVRSLQLHLEDCMRPRTGIVGTSGALWSKIKTFSNYSHYIFNTVHYCISEATNVYLSLSIFQAFDFFFLI